MRPPKKMLSAKPAFPVDEEGKTVGELDVRLDRILPVVMLADPAIARDDGDARGLRPLGVEHERLAAVHGADGVSVLVVVVVGGSIGARHVVRKIDGCPEQFVLHADVYVLRFAVVLVREKDLRFLGRLGPGDLDLETIETFKNELNQTTYKCSIGYSHRAGRDISLKQLLKEAEKAMYADKEEFYKNAELERRKA